MWKSKQQESDRRLVITESAIDALSYHQLFGHENLNTRYIATSGTISQGQLELISTAMAEVTNKGGEIVIATDMDRADLLNRRTEKERQPTAFRCS